ncbi:hypothetical protein [Bradyrhizobium sp. AZCC 2262]|uniref:hypothetical protein n=1 Tax=Bradyrhizobium sp. AZCC 2262 TaxID=3117022 RepID=UPI002FF0A38F
MSNTTVKLLSTISDEGFFERLATAILREAEPRYSALVHPGVNADGKTVKSPLDGITFVPGANPAHLIAVHHTTTKASDLKSKWLHDPATVTPRKGRRPTEPAGDLVKTASIVGDQRSRSPELEATLVLTTNQEPSIETVQDLNDAAQKYAITVDLWHRSRLAHFLDKPEGQWIRHTYLGIEPEYISRELLAKLSRDSAHSSKPIDDHSNAWIDRSLDRVLEAAPNDIVFVVAESGFGKSVACYRKLLKHIGQGGFGIILPHEVLETSLNIDHAIDAALRQLHPQLVPNAANEARLSCDSTHPFLIVVEDINRSGRGAQLSEKLATWSRPDNHGKNDQADTSRTWQLLCPLWPEVMLSLNDQARKRVEALSVSCAPLTTEEARHAVQRRAAIAGRILTDIDANAIADALGHDPLLIALHDLSKTPDAYKVVDEFIVASLSRAASKHPEFTAPDYHATLSALSQQMLARRQLEPAWSDIVTWFGLTGGITNIIRRLLEHGEIVRLAAGAANARLRFRHDRVRESLLSSAVAEMMTARTLDGSILADPFFAEVIGGALADQASDAASIEAARDTNPLALFYALRRLGKPNAPNYHPVMQAINTWLDRQGSYGAATKHLMWHAAGVLAQTDSPDVVALAKRLPVRGTTTQFARLRNGDVGGGIELCQTIDFGSLAPWRDSQIEHAKMRCGKNLTSRLSEILQQSGIGEGVRSGALRLAGHLADPSLYEAIAVSWNIDPERADHLQDYLWAGAECCSDDPARVLGPVCDAWAALPDKPEKEHHSSPRDSLAAFGVRYAFRQTPPVRAIKYLIERVNQSELNWPITYLLHEIDNPDAVEFIARQLGDTARRLQETGGFSPFAMTAVDRWDPDRQRGPGPMSAPSKSRLLGLWTEPECDAFLREQAFRLWSASAAEGDLEILRQIDATDGLFDAALYQRLKRGDHQAIPSLLDKLKTERESFWWQAGRYLWSDAMTAALDASFQRRAETAERSWDAKERDGDWISSENLLRLPSDVAEKLLLKHWEHFRYVPNFVQAALFVATPELRSLVAATMAECPDPKALMQFIDTHYNIKRGGGSGVTRLVQVEALVPYLDLLGDLAIDHFWRRCNERGWFEFRRQHLDSRLSHPRYTELLGEENTFKALDEFAEKDRIHWVDHYLERLLTTGVTLDDVVQEIYRWFNSRGTIDALRIMSVVLIEIGRRSDLAALDNVHVEPHEIAAQIKADTVFAVMRRTLH